MLEIYSLLKKFSKYLLFIAGLWVLVRITLESVDYPELAKNIATFPIMKIALILTLSTLIMVLRSWRFQLLLRWTNSNISFWDATKIYIAGQATSPFPGGEALRGVLLTKQTGEPFRSGSGALIMQGYVELLVASAIGVLGSVFVPQLRLVMLLGAFTLLLVSILFLNHNFISAVVALTHRTFLKDFTESISVVRDQVKGTIYLKNTLKFTPVMIQSYVISLLTMVLSAVILSVIAGVYSPEINIAEAVVIHGAGTMIALLDNLSPVGAGFSDGGVVGLFAILGVSVTTGITIVLLVRAASLLYNFLIGIVFFGLFYAKDFWKGGKA